MSMNTTISLSVKPRQTLTAPYEGRGAANFAYGAEWTSGTGDDQADLCTQSVNAIAGSGNSDIDLRAEVQRRCAGRHRVRVGAHRNLGHRSLLNHPDA